MWTQIIYMRKAMPENTVLRQGTHGREILDIKHHRVRSDLILVASTAENSIIHISTREHASGASYRSDEF
jgi:hypothetical protein